MQQKQVAILESRMGTQLAALVAGRGGIPFHAPALAELPDLDQQAIGALVRSLETRPAKLAVFQTGVGTKALFAATDALAVTEKFLASLNGMLVAARGPKPTALCASAACASTTAPPTRSPRMSSSMSSAACAWKASA